MISWVREGGWELVVDHEHDEARFEPIGLLRESDSVQQAGARQPRGSARAVVEIVAISGGLRPRALIGGEFVPNSGDQLSIEVNHSGDLRLGASADCSGLAKAKPLVAGLPLEFAQAAIDGLVRVACGRPFSAGVLTIDRGAHDEVDSSPIAFEKAAGILRCVLASISASGIPDEDEIRRLLL